MTAKLPIIEEFLEARDDAARARLLLTCPASILLTYVHVFTDCCGKAGFDLGNDYLAVFLTSMRSTRADDGYLKSEIGELLRVVQAELAALAAPNTGPVPADDPTEL